MLVCVVFRNCAGFSPIFFTIVLPLLKQQLDSWPASKNKNKFLRISYKFSKLGLDFGNIGS